MHRDHYCASAFRGNSTNFSPLNANRTSAQKFSELNRQKLDALYKTCYSRLKITHTTFTFLTSLYILSAHALTLAKAGKSAFYISSLSHVSYLLTTGYYLIFVSLSAFKRTYLRYLIIFFTFAINGVQSLAFWFTPSANQPIYHTSHNYGHGYLFKLLTLGTNMTLYQLIFLWWIFQFANRNLITLLIWEFEVLLSTQAHLRIYRLYCIFSPLIFWLLWRFIPGFMVGNSFKVEIFLKFSPDLISSPSLLSALVWTVGTGTIYFCWVSFLTFQYRGVVWFKPFREGFLVFLDEGKSLLCELY